jgi:phage/plasmid-like protein (TIGR03299 family)
MSAGILELDRLIVGLTERYGKAWHNHENCRHLDGVVPFEEARETVDYEVAKVQAFLPADLGGGAIDGSFALVRKGNDGNAVVLYPSVGNRYTEIQNGDIMDWLKASILDEYQVSIESVGTLLNGQKAFLNLILNEHIVPGDVSPTVTRLMYSNSFGGDSVQACVHGTRIVCQNTLRMAGAQGAANKTLRKFRHTKNAAERVEAHMVDLAGVVAQVQEHHQELDHLASLQMTSADVEKVLKVLVPLPEKEGRGKTRANNKRAAILDLFENKDDLQGQIARTRYAFLNAVTDWADHVAPVRGGDDEMGRFWDGVWGLKDGFKQKALDALLVA